ncbi:uncharacterized protein LOC111360868 isoform X2 [Spodoptera litura]|uniref:Uncharacterized protein LOC111360868 isoform X2 n=1 Tax=Spodoptera litura TaxID=69820 RepID=A0A9J7IXZ4_SPOLT|nr:uncharacterized protein LOC111360868 isoform X2 [Spodoptera litura]
MSFFCVVFFILYCNIFSYYSVFGKREILQRYVIEDGAKPPIFGSYSYDPVKQVFIPPASEDGHENPHPEPQPVPPPVLQTKPGKTTNSNCLNNTGRPIFRKHVTDITEFIVSETEPGNDTVTVTVSETPGFPITNWWDKPNAPKSTTPKNITSNVINKK